MKKRSLDLDFSRGFAMILIVLGHIIRGLNDSNIQISNFELIDYILYSIHLPILFIVSGIVERRFSKKDHTKNKFIKFFKNNIISLYFPYITFILFYWIIKMFIFKGNNEANYSDLLFICFSGKWIFWYLLSLLFIKIVHYLFEYNNKIFNAFLFFLLVYILNYFVSFTPILWLSYGFFYSCGYIYELCNEKYDDFSKKCMIVFSVLLIFSFTLFNQIENNVFVGMIIYGIPVSLLLINISQIIKKQNLITLIGEYSMILYLTHTIVTSVIRTLLLKFNIINITINIITGFFASIFVTFLIVFMYKKFKIFRWVEYLFYPTRSKR